MNTQGKNFVYEFCVLFTRHIIYKRNFCLVYSWVNNTLAKIQIKSRLPTPFVPFTLNILPMEEILPDHLPFRSQ
jgi:hypothetical protein